MKNKRADGQTSTWELDMENKVASLLQRREFNYTGGQSPKLNLQVMPNFRLVVA